MAISHRLSTSVIACAQLTLGVAAELNYRRLPIADAAPVFDYGKVSIIIPARNEAARLPHLLGSLKRLTYPDVEIIVVDDGSDDGTHLVAEAERVRVLRLAGPPDGWTGKAYACSRGAEMAEGQWLLFTDADTTHCPESLSTALGMSLRHGAPMVSLLCQQSCETFWERLLLPYAYFLYFSGAFGINRTAESAVANGQYILVARETYRSFGGHAAVRTSLVDDVQLARTAARHEVRVLLARGEHLVRVRMYESLSALWEGFAKNSFRFVVLSPRRGAITACAGVVCGIAVTTAARCRAPLGRTLVLATPALALISWHRRFRAPLSLVLLYPLAASVFQLIALDSMRKTLTGAGATWKGRVYR